MCEQLAQSERPEVEPATCLSHVQRPNHYTSTLYTGIQYVRSKILYTSLRFCSTKSYDNFIVHVTTALEKVYSAATCCLLLGLGVADQRCMASSNLWQTRLLRTLLPTQFALCIAHRPVCNRLWCIYSDLIPATVSRVGVSTYSTYCWRSRLSASMQLACGMSCLPASSQRFWHKRLTTYNKKDGYRQQNVRQRQKLMSIIDYDVCILVR